MNHYCARQINPERQYKKDRFIISPYFHGVKWSIARDKRNLSLVSLSNIGWLWTSLALESPGTFEWTIVW